MRRALRPGRWARFGIILGLGVATTAAADSGVQVDEAEGRVRVSWPISGDESGSAVFSLDPGRPLIESLGIASAGGAATPVA